MSDEREVTDALREFGCPYAPTDPRTGVWLDGYRRGHRAAGEMAIAAAERTVAEFSGKRVQ